MIQILTINFADTRNTRIHTQALVDYDLERKLFGCPASTGFDLAARHPQLPLGRTFESDRSVSQCVIHVSLTLCTSRTTPVHFLWQRRAPRKKDCGRQATRGDDNTFATFEVVYLRVPPLDSWISSTYPVLIARSSSTLTVPDLPSAL